MKNLRQIRPRFNPVNLPVRPAGGMVRGAAEQLPRRTSPRPTSRAEIVNLRPAGDFCLAIEGLT